ncbi:poly(A) binding protein Nab3 [Schizosaccharomyces japonicus yFS275]|uniref:Poly(A) binding protein Nab3 n=1 Tax=Schizosaccharomyces japonicus (strain yFS275 / FY16936) TaxID=402676 RepID=B6K2U7_SCHJY|nr:poly(A) binding protein Nab3 [Schizosaccharomyces japonicus yFS275]EEB08587.2 poly(A) binding protein Nab3 [Schizosaccharomyces japonicus yFS275]
MDSHQETQEIDQQLIASDTTGTASSSVEVSADAEKSSIQPAVENGDANDVTEGKEQNDLSSALNDEKAPSTQPLGSSAALLGSHVDAAADSSNPQTGTDTSGAPPIYGESTNNGNIVPKSSVEASVDAQSFPQERSLTPDNEPNTDSPPYSPSANPISFSPSVNNTFPSVQGGQPSELPSVESLEPPAQPSNIDIQAILSALVPSATSLSASAQPTSVQSSSAVHDAKAPSFPHTLASPIDSMSSYSHFTNTAHSSSIASVSSSVEHSPLLSIKEISSAPEGQNTRKNGENKDIVYRFQPSDEPAYQQFLETEKKIMSSWYPGQFPDASRLFLGNLPPEKVSKREVWKIFEKYGRLAQISLKQTYGFAQFFTNEECAAALHSEQGTMLQGRKLHLDTSKPQKKYQQQIGALKRSRRSRSPERRSASPSRLRGKRDQRSRSPNITHFHELRTPEEYSMSMRHAVPDCQIVVTDDCARTFVRYVEKVFRTHFLSTDTMYLSSQTSLSSIVRQLLLENVMAILYINTNLERSGKVSLQIFKKTSKEFEIHYDEYTNIDAPIAAELLARAKSNALQYSSAMQVSNTNNSYSPQNAVLQQAAGLANPNLANIIGGLSVSGLRQLVTTLLTSSALPSSSPSSFPFPSSLNQVSNSNPSLYYENAAQASPPVYDPNTQSPPSQYPFISGFGVPGPSNMSAAASQAQQQYQGIMENLAKLQQQH